MVVQWKIETIREDEKKAVQWKKVNQANRFIKAARTAAAINQIFKGRVFCTCSSLESYCRVNDS